MEKATQQLAPPSTPKGWLTDKTLEGPAKLWRTVTFNSPLVGAAILGGTTALAGWHLSPWIDRIISPKFSEDDQQASDDQQSWEYMSSEERRDKRKTNAIWGGLLGTMAALAPVVTTKKPYLGLLSYGPMHKNNNMWGAIPIGAGMDMINNNHELSDAAKLSSLALLGSFNAPPTATVTGNDLIGQAIGTGISAAKGAAVGFMTAKALGLSNPGSTAILGAVTNTLGLGPALAGSLIFGH